ncbi:hypothetical protein N7527_009452 [Penicillium freii]|nr:hypothetical protein N7527_009452 [Penicillium freii]
MLTITVKTTLTVAKIQTAMNQFEEAEQIFLEGLPIAKRNLGGNQLGTLIPGLDIFAGGKNGILRHRKSGKI